MISSTDFEREIETKSCGFEIGKKSRLSKNLRLVQRLNYDYYAKKMFKVHSEFAILKFALVLR